MRIFDREPALLLGAANALLALAVGFGLDVDSEQVGLINAALAAVIAFATRQAVFAPATVTTMVEEHDAEVDGILVAADAEIEELENRIFEQDTIIGEG